MGNRKPSVKWAQGMLSHVSADCDYGSWFAIACALHSGLGASDGWLVFNEWSQTAPARFNAAAARKLWGSLDGRGRIGWGTLVRRAQESGWKAPKRTKRLVYMTHWLIRDSTGAPQALKIRFWDTKEEQKTDRWATPAPDFVDMQRDSYFEWKLKGRSQKTIPLYGAEKLATKPADCRAVIITEGGADADALEPIAAKHGAMVLAVMTGAPVYPNVEVFKDVAAASEKGAIDEVLLWPDQDDSGVGRRLMAHVGKQIVNAGGPEPGIIDWEVPEQIAASTKGAGAADWARAGAQPPLPDLIAEAKPWEPPRAGRPRKDGGRAPAGPSFPTAVSTALNAGGGGGDSKEEKSNAPTIEDLANGRVPIEVETGLREVWMMDTVDTLVEAGKIDELHGFYENTVSTGKQMWLWSRLAFKPPGDVAPGVTLRGKALLIEWATKEYIVSQVDKLVCLYRVLPDGAVKPVEMSPGQVGIMLSHYADRQLEDTGARFPPLVGIVEAPTISSEGKLIRESGYNKESGLYANFRTEDWSDLIPECPDEADARKAVSKLYDLVSETLWQEDNKEVYKAAWLAGLLTVAARSYVRGNVPGILISGNDSGTGKGTLCDIISAICLGRLATKLPPVGGRPADADAEERKRMTSVVMLGETMIVVDNVPAGSPYGNPAIDMALTTGSDTTIGEYADRLLGVNEMVKVPFRIVPFVTGNGLEVTGDLGRRGILIRLYSKQAEPAMRRFAQYPRIVDHCLKNRRELLAAALTIVLAYKSEAAKGKKVKFKLQAGSFGDWSDRIRAAVFRYTGYDPWEANRELRETAQPERRHLWALLEAIYRTFGADEITLNQIDDACDRSAKDFLIESIADAVDELTLAPPRGGQHVNTRALGAYLSRNKERGGPFVLHRGTGRKWFVSLGETAPRDLLAATQQQRSPEVERAIEALLTGFPENTSVLGHTIRHGLAETLGEFGDAELLALRSVCVDGQTLAELVQDEVRTTYTKIWTGQVMDVKDYLEDEYPDLTAAERVQTYLREVISRLAQRAPNHGVRNWIYEEDLKRENNFISLRAVETAVGKLGPDADDEAVKQEAYKLAVSHFMATENEPNKATKEETSRVRDEIVAAIDQLVGSRRLPHGIDERAKAGRSLSVRVLWPRPKDDEAMF